MWSCREAPRALGASPTLRWPALAAAIFAFSCGPLLGDVDVSDVSGEGSGRPSATSDSTAPQTPPQQPSVDAPAGVSAPALGATPVADGACAAGSFRCSGSALEYCDTSGWFTWQTCGSAALCESEPTGRCLPPACIVGARRCDGASLELCNADATGWLPLQACPTEAHCDTASA
jgi:hypothetical protein